MSARHHAAVVYAYPFGPTKHFRPLDHQRTTNGHSTMATNQHSAVSDKTVVRIDGLSIKLRPDAQDRGDRGDSGDPTKAVRFRTDMPYTALGGVVATHVCHTRRD